MSTTNSSDGLFAGASTQTLKSVPEASNEKNDGALLRLLFWLMVFCIAIGAEATKVIFRKNYSVTINRFIRIILSVVAFAYIGKLLITKTLNGAKVDFSFVMGSIYILLALYILIWGITYFIKSLKGDANLSEKGESTVLSFLGKDGLNNNIIQNLVEPLFILAVGVFFLGFDLIAGVGLIGCAIGYWLNFLFELIFDRKDLSQAAIKENNNINKKRIVHQVN